MKKGKLLNADLSATIARLGHTQHLTVADAGLPIPGHANRIDLSVIAGLPSFMQVVEAITTEMQVEHILLAQEIAKANPEVHEQLLQHIQALEKQQGNAITIEYVSHEAFKQLSGSSQAVIRTGECSPYANVILCSGVTF